MARARRGVLVLLAALHAAQAVAHSLTPLEALRFSQQEAQEDLVQPGRHLTEFLTSNKDQHPDLALRQARHDYCGRGIPPERLIVVAAARYNLDFIAKMGFDYVAYQHLDPEAPFYYNNAGNEAGAYLQFMIDHYDCLPKAMAFIHGHENETWHSESMHSILPRLKWNESAFADVNMKMGAWDIPIANISLEPFGSILANGTDAYNGSFSTHQIHRGRAYSAFEMGLWLQWTSMSRAFDKFFGLWDFGPMPAKIRYVCCAQFVVGAQRIRHRPKAFYIAAKEYLLDNDIRGNHIQTRKYIIGDVFTLYWGMVFGDGPLYEVKEECQTFHCDGKHGKTGHSLARRH